MRRPNLSILLLLVSVLGVSPAVAERSWLPERVFEGAAAQLGARLTQVKEIFGGGEPNPERLAAGTRRVVESMAEVIEGWGVDGVFERTPDLASFEIPANDSPFLEAMGSYQLCNAALMIQLENPAYREDTNRRMTSVFGLSAVTLVVVYLREPFLAGGGSMAELEAHLTGPTFEPVVAAVQTDPELLGQLEAACQPVVVELLEKPLMQLGSPEATP